MLRAGVQCDLENWGTWSGVGSAPRLGVVAMPWPRKSTMKRFDADGAWATESTLSTWSMCSTRAEWMCFVLKVWYVEGISCDEARGHFKRKFGRSLSYDGFYDLLDEAEFGYWVLTL